MESMKLKKLNRQETEAREALVTRGACQVKLCLPLTYGGGIVWVVSRKEEKEKIN